MLNIKYNQMVSREVFLEASGVNLYFLDRVLQLLNNYKKSRFLDIGCGTGIFSKSLAVSSGWEAYGTELSHSAHKLASKRIKCSLVDGVDLPFPDDFFSLVVTKDVIPTISDKERWFNEISRVLKRNGIFVSYMPNKSDFLEKPLYEFIPNSQQRSKEVYGQQQNIITLMVGAGFFEPHLERLYLGTVQMNQFYIDKHRCGYFSNSEGEKLSLAREIGLGSASRGLNALSAMGIATHYEWERTLLIGKTHD